MMVMSKNGFGQTKLGANNTRMVLISNSSGEFTQFSQSFDPLKSHPRVIMNIASAIKTRISHRPMI